MTVSFIGNDCVSGLFNGSIALWKASSLENMVKAHTGPCTSLTPRKKGKGVISGGKNGDIMFWDEKLQNISTINISECGLNLSQMKVISLCENSLGDILVGLRGSEILLIKNKNVTQTTILN